MDLSKKVLKKVLFITGIEKSINLLNLLVLPKK